MVRSVWVVGGGVREVGASEWSLVVRVGILGWGGVIGSMVNWVVAVEILESNNQGGILVAFGKVLNFAFGPKSVGWNLLQNFRSCSLLTKVYALSDGPNFSMVKDRSSSKEKAVRADGRAFLISTDLFDSLTDQEFRRSRGRFSVE